eukprot:ANDGO_02521.mRNA.1 Carbon catabolite repressor protein 4 homolog 1
MAVSVLYAKVPSTVAVGASVDVLFEVKATHGRMVPETEKHDLVDIKWFRITSSSNSGSISNHNSSSNNQQHHTKEVVGVGRTYYPVEKDVGSSIRVIVHLKGSNSSCESCIENVLPSPQKPAPRALMSSRSFYRTMSMPGLAVRVASYNILSPAYATDTQYPYAKSWCLDISFRRSLVLEHLLWLDADIVCLQEVPRLQYTSFFLPELQKRGYEGSYKQKSSDTTHDNQLDGCAVFFKGTKFACKKTKDVEFLQSARQIAVIAAEKELLVRFGKQNVGQLVLLELLPFTEQPPVRMNPPAAAMQGGMHSSASFSEKDFYPAWVSPKRFNGPPAGATTTPITPSKSPFSAISNLGKGPAHNKYVIVANLHVVSDTKLNDVKLFQVHALTQAISLFAAENGVSTDGEKGDTAVVYCGDFNSSPDSAVYEYITTGTVAPEHIKDIDTTGSLNRIGDLWHNLHLQSAYVSALGAEPEYTNYTQNFVGCLDYVFFSDHRARVSAVLVPPVVDEILEEVALPSSGQPSDHVPVMADIFL